MQSTPNNPLKSKPALRFPQRSAAVKIALAYAAVGVLWVLCSGWLLDHLAPDQEWATQIEALKDLPFIAGTALFLGFALSRCFGATRHSARLLQESEARFRALFEQAAVGVAEIETATGHFLRVNQRYCDIFGYSREEMLRLDFQALTHPDDLAADLARMESLKAGAIREFASEKRCRRKDGGVVCVALAAAPLWSPGAVPTTHVAVVQDVTDSKQAEQEVREARELFHSLFMLSPTAYSLADMAERVIIDVNTAWEDLFGYSRAEVVGRPATDFEFWQQPEEQLAVYQKMQHAGRLWEHEFDFKTKSGLIRHAAMYASILEQGGEKYIFSVFIDRTERKQAEAALRRSEGHLRTLVNTLPDLIWLKDPQGVYLACNTRFESMYGAPEAEIVGKTDFDFSDRERAEFFRANDAAAVAAGGPRKNEEEVPFASDGHREFLETIKTPMFDTDGNLIGVLGIGRNITERKQAEEALEASEEQYRLLFSANPNPMFVFDEETLQFLAVNDTAVKHYGWSREEFLLMTILDIRPPEDKETAGNIIRGNVGLRKVDLGTVRHWRKDGTVMYMELRAISISFAGRSARMVSLNDITERKRAEEAVRRSEEQVRLKLDSILSPDVEVEEEELVNLLDIPALQPLMDNFSELSHAVVAILDTRGKVLLSSGWQDICCRFHRINPESAHNCTESDLALSESVSEGEHVAYHCRNGLWDVVTPLMIGGKHVGNIFTGQFFYEDDAIDEEFFAAQAARFGFDRESYLAALHQVPRVSRQWVSTLMVFLTKFSELISRSSFSNLKLAKALTQQKRIEDDLRQSEEQFRAMFEVASIGMAQADTQSGRFLRVNQRLSEITGYPISELLDMGIRDVTHPDDRDQDWELFQRVVRGEAPNYRVEKRYVRKNGQVLWVNVNMTLIRDADERPLRTMATIEDITERKRLEMQLRQAQKLEAVGQLAGGVAHDFNNILAAIMMHLGLLRMNPDLNTAIVQSLDELNIEAQRAASLTRQLLMFSRRSVLAVKPQDLNELTANLLKMLTRLIREDIKLSFESGGGLPTVEADAGMMEQILMNLVVNARDAMPKGGRITISTSQTAFTEADLAANPERRAGCFVCLAVADTGCGMDAETLKHIFEPFFTTKEAGKGTGLGLATVYGIVAQHKGWVEVDSAVGKGTTFRIFLESMAEAVVKEAGVAHSASLPRGRETILLVEDNEEVRRTVGETLRFLGYQVYEAPNGQAAVNLWQIHGQKIDLLLTDMVMPEGMTGLQLAEKLQSLKPGLKVIISSGYSAEIVQAGVPDKSGVVYLPKPYETSVLAGTVRNCLHLS